jgi:hypothetical protein
MRNEAARWAPVERAAQGFVMSVKAAPRLAALVALLVTMGSPRAGSEPVSPSAPSARVEIGLEGGLLGRTGPGPSGFAYPVRLDIGIGGSRFFIGLLGQVGFGVPSCPTSCSNRMFAIGPELVVVVDPRADRDGWLGVAGGWQRFVETSTYSGDASTTESSGWFIELRMGLEWKLGRVFRVGPWLSFGLGQVSGPSTSSQLGFSIGAGLRLGLAL